MNLHNNFRFVIPAAEILGFETSLQVHVMKIGLVILAMLGFEGSL